MIEHTDTPKIVKILHVTFDMRIGGTEMVIKNIIEGNTKSHHEMSIFCIEEPLGPWGQDLQKRGVAVNSVNREEGFDIKMIKAIRKHIKDHNIDVMHCHQYTPWVYATLASLGLGVKIIFTEHGRFYPDSSSWKRKYINPVLSYFTDHITAISQATKQALVEFEYLKEQNIDVVYNGIVGLKSNLEKRPIIKQELGLDQNNIVFGTIARLDPIKNHEMMINAFADVCKNYENARLIIIGDGDLMEQLKEQVENISIADKVIFTGYLAYPKNYLSIFDIFLLSSLSEGTSMTLLESMSLAKPCIVTDAGGNKEIIANHENGVVTKNDDAHEFAEAMKLLLNDKSLRKKYADNALVRFNELFDAKIMSERYAGYYDS